MGYLKSWVVGEKILAADLNKCFALFYLLGNNVEVYADAVCLDSANANMWCVRNSGGARRITKHEVFGYTSALEINSNVVSLASYDLIANTIINLDSYLYTWQRLTAGLVWTCVRITKSDGTLTNMTFSGTPPDNDGGASIATDGTFVYIADTGTTKVRKYSLSGTTLTYVADITLSQATQGLLFLTDGTYFVYNKNGAATMIVVDTLAGANVTSYLQAHTLFGSGFAFGGLAYGLVNFNINGAELLAVVALAN